MDRLRYIEDLVRRVARANNVANDALPTFGRSDQSGRPHIEVTGDVLHYVVCERGSEFERKSTRVIDELLYQVFQSATFGIACSHELENRIAGQDSRRLLFSYQEEILRVMNPEWGIRLGLEHRTILAEHPFDDSTGTST